MPAPKPPEKIRLTPETTITAVTLPRYFARSKDELDAKPEAPENREPDRP